MVCEESSRIHHYQIIRFRIWTSSPHFSDNKEHLLLNPVNFTQADVVYLFRCLKINIVKEVLKGGAHLVGGCVESEARLIVAASNA